MEAGMTSTRRSCFFEGYDGLASIVEMETAGSSGAGNCNSHHHHPFFSRMVMPRRRGSTRNIASLSSSAFNATTAGYSCYSPRSPWVYDTRFEEFNHPPHFLDACFLCKKPLGANRDIYMYRGDTPFCSEECRQDQIDRDEAKEKKRNLKAMRSRKKDSSAQKSPSSSPKSQDYPYRAGTVAVA